MWPLLRFVLLICSLLFPRTMGWAEGAFGQWGEPLHLTTGGLTIEIGLDKDDESGSLNPRLAERLRTATPHPGGF
jgi:hypothetical protein